MLKNKVVLIALNKPRGFICTHKDEFDRKKAIDLIPKKTLNNINGKIHSVGRLDYNSQGLLLLTNNTKIKNYLESPSNKIIRIYRVKIQGIVDYKTIKKIEKGLIINKLKHQVKSIKIINTTKSYSWILIKLDQGKNNHIRKIFKRLGFSVNKLNRIQYGPVKLSSLKSGTLKLVSPFKLNLSDL